MKLFKKIFNLDYKEMFLIQKKDAENLCEEIAEQQELIDKIETDLENLRLDCDDDKYMYNSITLILDLIKEYKI